MERNVRMQAAAQPTAPTLRPSLVTPPVLRNKRTKADLKEPARIGATSKSRAVVKDRGGDVSLTAYMTLPLEQYFVLDPTRIVFLGADRFLLKVPRVNLFNLYLEPEVEVSVLTQAQPARVVLTAQNCRIKGSPGITNMHIDDKFCLSFVTQLSWGSLPAALPTSAPSSSSPSTSAPSASITDWLKFPSSPSSPPAAAAAAGGDPSSSSSNGGGGLQQALNRVRGVPAARDAQPDAEILGSAVLDVYSEVVAPFHLLPRPALESSCNVVMRGLVNSLLPLFVRQLAEDYDRWATDPAYRAARAARCKPLGSVDA